MSPKNSIVKMKIRIAVKAKFRDLFRIQIKGRECYYQAELGAVGDGLVYGFSASSVTVDPILEPIKFSIKNLV